MATAERVDVDILGPYREACGMLRISLLPSARTNSPPFPLLDLRNDTNRDESLEPVQLLEGFEYRYEFHLSGQGKIATNKPEIFEPDDQTGRTGRLRPGLRTGSLPITVEVSTRLVGELALEVRSRKLDYLAQYRWMLRDLAESMAEVIMERFGPTEQRFSLVDNVDAKTLYQRFAFLQSLLRDEAFDSALHRIATRPYETWRERTELRRPAEGIRASSSVIRGLTKSGPKSRLPSGSRMLGALSIPMPLKIEVLRSEGTLDNYPNRFIKFALRRWLLESTAVLTALLKEEPSAPVRRGIAEARGVIAFLAAFLASGFLRGVGKFDQIVPDNPVLIRREGYRDVYRSFLQFELAAQLNWTGGEEVYGAGQRNVATLYEYWTFLQLATALSSICDKRFDFSQLFESDGLSLVLKAGRAVVLSGSLTRQQRTIEVELWFNRSFRNTIQGLGSWTQTMRPDCSVRFKPDRVPGFKNDEVWLHFDAKYRIDELRAIFAMDDDPEESPTPTRPHASGSANSGDILKMHAYRDAIHRTAGAFVLYPGDAHQQFNEYHEILPGLGAFPLRPAQSGESVGRPTLRAFLNDVIDHLASQITEHERARFWERASYANQIVAPRRLTAARFLSRPPADTKVLLGYAKNQQHAHWIETAGLYNLRGDSRRGSVGLSAPEVGADLLLLYGTDAVAVRLFSIAGEVIVVDAEQLRATGYPDPRGTLYFCLPVEPLDTTGWEVGVRSGDVRRYLSFRFPEALKGAPIATTWLDVTTIQTYH